MILRRVIEHVKKQHWTAVFLDFVIVVLGVFIGIQVSNWNAARAQRVAAADFHERLLTDMRLEEFNYRVIETYYRDAQKAAETAYKGLTGEIELSDAELLINAFRGSQYNWMERHRSTFDELVASGNFDLIADTELRTIITGYFAATYLEDLSRDNQNSEYRVEFRKTIPPGLHESLNEQCGDKQIEGAPLGAMTLGYPCVLELPSENISDAVAALQSNENLLPALRLHIVNLSSWNFTLETNYTAYKLGTFKQDGGAAMILRRVIDHVKKQHWTAVFLDFVIVVVGVFIGIQVSNWNAERADRHEYKQALLRYREELQTNLTILDTMDRDNDYRRAAVVPAFDALLSCEDSPENRALIERGLIEIAGTTGLRLRDSALRELTQSQRLLAQQSELERKQFAETRYIMTVFLGEAQFLEDAPLAERMENNPILVVGPRIDRPTKVIGVDYSVQQRSLKLSVPVDIACKDNTLVKSFYTWERWQSVLPSVGSILRTEFKSSLERLDK